MTRRRSYRLGGSILVLAFGLLGALGTAGILGYTAAGPRLRTASPEQDMIRFEVFGYTDVVGGPDPVCPGCDLDRGADPDEDMPEPWRSPGSFSVGIYSPQGERLATVQTWIFGTGTQMGEIYMPPPPDGEYYVIALDAPPSGWILCPGSDPNVRVTNAHGWHHGNTRAEYYFNVGCPQFYAPLTPTALATPTPAMTPGGDPETPRATPTPTGVATGPSPTHTRTLTPTSRPWTPPTPARTSTALPTTTVTPTDLPAPSSSALRLPTERSLPATYLQADLVGTLGLTTAATSVAHDLERAAVHSDGRIWVYRLEEPKAILLGTITLEQDQAKWLLLGLSGTTAILVSGSRLRLVDLTQFGGSARSTALDLPIVPNTMAMEGDALFLAGAAKNDASSKGWLATITGAGGGAPRLAMSRDLKVAWISDLMAANGKLAMNFAQDRDGSTWTGWRLMDTADPVQLRVESEHPGWAMGILDGGLLVLYGHNVSVYEISALPSLVKRGSWDGDYIADWARFGMDGELLVRYISWGPSGALSDTLVRLIPGGPGGLVELARQSLPLTANWSGPRGFCYVKEEDSPEIHCQRSRGQTSHTSLDHRILGAEPIRYASRCTDVTALGQHLVLSCGDKLQRLVATGDGGPWRLTYLQYNSRRMSTGLERTWSSRRMLTQADRLFVQTDEVRLLRQDSNGRLFIRYGVVDSGHQIALGEGLAAFIIAVDRSANSNVVRIVDLKDQSRRFDTWVQGLDLGVTPLIASGKLWLAADDGATLVLDLAAAPGPGQEPYRWTGVPLSSLAVSGDVAYVLRQTSRSPNGEPGLEMDVVDWSTGAPREITRVEDLGDVPLENAGALRRVLVAGRELLVDRGGGWVTRLSLANPRRPQLLQPVLTEDIAPRLTVVDERRWAALGADEDLALFAADAAADAVRLPGWSPWTDRLEGPLAQVAGRLLTSRWSFDLSDPRLPRRQGALNGLGLTAATVSRAKGVNTAFKVTGPELRGYKLSDGSAPIPIQRWCGLGGRCPARSEAVDFAAVTALGSHVFALSRDGTLLVLEDRGPDTPPRQAAIRRMAGLSGPDLSQLVVFGDHLLAYPGQGEPYAINVATPELPQPLGPLSGLPGPIQHSVTQGRIAVVAIGAEVISLRSDASGAISVVDRIALPEPVLGLETDQPYIYAVVVNAIWRLNLDTNGRMSDLAALNLPGVSSLAAQQGHLYLSHAPQPQVEIWGDIRPGGAPLPTRGPDPSPTPESGAYPPPPTATPLPTDTPPPTVTPKPSATTSPTTAPKPSATPTHGKTLLLPLVPRRR